jgi:hypothetical protein
VAPALAAEKVEQFVAMVQKNEREKEVLEKANMLANTKSTSEQKKTDADLRPSSVRKEDLEVISVLIGQNIQTKTDASNMFVASGGNPPVVAAVADNELFKKMQESFTAKLATKSVENKVAAKTELKTVDAPVVKEEAVVAEKAVVANWNDNKKLIQLFEEEDELLDEVQTTPVKRLGLAMRFAA